MITGKSFKSIKCNDINDDTIDKPVIRSYAALIQIGQWQKKLKG